MRGKAPVASAVGTIVRITPAYAGKSYAAHTAHNIR